MTNPYITKIGNLLPQIEPVIKEIFESQSFYDKQPKYRKIGDPLFERAMSGREYVDAVLPVDEVEELVQRIRANFKEFSGVENLINCAPEDNPEIMFAQFLQANIQKEKEQQIIDLLPEWIKKNNLTYMLQVADKGRYLMIHSDHERKSSLWYLLTPPDAETRFYSVPDDYVIYTTRYAKPEDVTLEHTEIILQNTWYAFNNQALHSVHALDMKQNIYRASFLIEFVDLPYNNLMRLIEENN